MNKVQSINEQYWQDEWMFPGFMLDFVIKTGGTRKLRLYGVACCRSVWHAFSNKSVREAIEAAEKWADKEISESALRKARRIAKETERSETRFGYRRGHLTPPNSAAELAEMMHVNPQYHAAVLVVSWRKDVLFQVASDCISLQAGINRFAESTKHCRLLRDIFGNPFRPVAFGSAWQTPTSVALAQTMYDSRDFAAMPVLADALEESGCEVPEVLSHCRDPQGVHVRGCWVVDLVLGKS